MKRPSASGACAGVHVGGYSALHHLPSGHTVGSGVSSLIGSSLLVKPASLEPGSVPEVSLEDELDDEPGFSESTVAPIRLSPPGELEVSDAPHATIRAELISTSVRTSLRMFVMGADPSEAISFGELSDRGDFAFGRVLGANLVHVRTRIPLLELRAMLSSVNATRIGTKRTTVRLRAKRRDSAVRPVSPTHLQSS